MHCIKREINKQLCHMTRGIQENSCSNRAWGEVKLPECLRRELENPDRVIR